jgi:hypothetical protein
MTGPLLGLVLSTLDRLGVRHALIGAAALAAHDIARSTYDVDLLTTDVRVLDAATWCGLTAVAGCQVEVRRGDATDPLAGLVRISLGGDPDVDIVVGKWSWQGEAVDRAAELEFAGLRLGVVAASDLVLLNPPARRPRRRPPPPG